MFYFRREAGTVGQAPTYLGTQTSAGWLIICPVGQHNQFILVLPLDMQFKRSSKCNTIKLEKTRERKRNGKEKTVFTIPESSRLSVREYKFGPIPRNVRGFYFDGAAIGLNQSFVIIFYSFSFLFSGRVVSNFIMQALEGKPLTVSKTKHLSQAIHLKG